MNKLLALVAILPFAHAGFVVHYENLCSLYTGYTKYEVTGNSAERTLKCTGGNTDNKNAFCDMATRVHRFAFSNAGIQSTFCEVYASSVVVTMKSSQADGACRDDVGFNDISGDFPTLIRIAACSTLPAPSSGGTAPAAATTSRATGTVTSTATSTPAAASNATQTVVLPLGRLDVAPEIVCALYTGSRSHVATVAGNERSLACTGREIPQKDVFCDTTLQLYRYAFANDGYSLSSCVSDGSKTTAVIKSTKADTQPACKNQWYDGIPTNLAPFVKLVSCGATTSTNSSSGSSGDSSSSTTTALVNNQTVPAGRVEFAANKLCSLYTGIVSNSQSNTGTERTLVCTGGGVEGATQMQAFCNKANEVLKYLYGNDGYAVTFCKTENNQAKVTVKSSKSDTAPACKNQWYTDIPNGVVDFINLISCSGSTGAAGSSNNAGAVTSSPSPSPSSTIVTDSNNNPLGRLEMTPNILCTLYTGKAVKTNTVSGSERTFACEGETSEKSKFCDAVLATFKFGFANDAYTVSSCDVSGGQSKVILKSTKSDVQPFCKNLVYGDIPSDIVPFFTIKACATKETASPVPAPAPTTPSPPTTGSGSGSGSNNSPAPAAVTTQKAPAAAQTPAADKKTDNQAESGADVAEISLLAAMAVGGALVL